MPTPAPTRPARRRALVAAALALAVAPAVATAAPGGDGLAARDRALARAEARLADRLTQERAALVATRARIEALRARHATHAATLRARLRALYASGGPDPLIAALAGDTAEAETRAALARAVDRSDSRMLAEYRASLADLRAAEAALAHRKRALSADARILAARRAAVRVRLRAVRRVALRAARAEAAALPQATSAAAPSTRGARGLPRAVREGRLLPGAPPRDARTGLPITLDRPAAGPPVTVALPGQGLVAVPGVAAAVRGPRRFTAMTAIRATTGAAPPTASGLPFAPAALAAAHRTLPLGTLLRLRRGDHEVVVRVVDRGPFVASRDLEVSAAAAAALRMRRPGAVRAEVLG